MSFPQVREWWLCSPDPYDPDLKDCEDEQYWACVLAANGDLTFNLEDLGEEAEPEMSVPLTRFVFNIHVRVCVCVLVC